MTAHPNRSKIAKPRKPVTKITRTVAERVLAVVDAGLVSGIGIAEPGKMCVEAAVCYAMGMPHGDNPDCVARSLRSLKIRLNDSAWSSDMARSKGLRRLAIAQLGSSGFLDESEFIKRLLGIVIRKAFPAAFRAVAAVVKDKDRRVKWWNLAERCEAAAERIEPREARQFFLEFKKNADADGAYADAAKAAKADGAYADAAAAYAAYADAAYAAAAYAAAAYAAAAYAAAAAAAAAAPERAEARDKLLATFCEWVVQLLIEMKAPGCQWLDLAEAA